MNEERDILGEFFFKSGDDSETDLFFNIQELLYPKYF